MKQAKRQNELLSPPTVLYPGPRGFSWFFCAWESCKRAAKRRTRGAKQQERKTSGYLGLESHFHADPRVRIGPSDSDWLIFLQTRKSIWLARLIGGDGGDSCHCTFVSLTFLRAWQSGKRWTRVAKRRERKTSRYHRLVVIRKAYNDNKITMARKPLNQGNRFGNVPGF